MLINSFFFNFNNFNVLTQIRVGLTKTCTKYNNLTTTYVIVLMHQNIILYMNYCSVNPLSPFIDAKRLSLLIFKERG